MKRNSFKKFFIHPIAIFVLACLTISCSEEKKETKAPEPVLPVPTERQLAWHEMEQYAFVHFTTNTFTDKEWGYGDESPEIFNPTAFDASQWTKTIKNAGLKGLILTCKHHDGFCLWPSEYTEHSVKNSPWENGEGDVVQAVRDACEKEGLKFGIYLSPWDRNHPDYGNPEYVTYYRNQLKEIFNKYGPVFEMWFDGANGGDGYYGGANETRKIDKANYYDWPTTLEMVREIEPQIIFFSDAGPDIRWVGNERGFVGETNWNTISTDTLYAGKSGITELLNTGAEGGENWVPAEVDVSIRPGWFYHAEENEKVKTPEKLFEIYLTSVGRGSNLLLNLPPDRRGILHENDVAALEGWKKMLDEAFSTNLAAKKPASASNVRGNDETYSAGNLTDGDKNTYWATDDEITSASFTIDLESPKTVKYVLVQEFIKLGQRVKSFEIEVEKDGNWQKVGSETTIGYKRIIPIDPVETSKVRVKITDSRACPLISNVEVY
ncbi:alpha-L-fucosidase [Flexithrix dorotheae]|uniref:alpha-L-fucosidase n=1 Tax=Flexithrix dorotheae TaxID=70993 RepID=UPI00036F89D9|nr:alpha-L-fucosidase [Flexithrix dorotheae]